jgi:uncharacterized protein
MARPGKRGLFAPLVAVALLLPVLAANALAYQLTHRRGDHPAREAPPALAGVKELRLRSADGLTLGAWHVRGRSDAPVVLLLHGNVGSRSTRVEEFTALSRAGLSVLALSLRAHGDSDGSFYEIGYDSVPDLEAAVSFLKAQHPHSKVVVAGFSLGASAALYAMPRLGTRVRGYLLEAPYRSLREAAEVRVAEHLPPPLSTLAAQLLAWVAPYHLGRPLDVYEPGRSLQHVPEGVHVRLVGMRSDPRVTPPQLEQLARDAHGRVELSLHRGSGHAPLARSEMSTFVHYVRSAGRP